MLDSSVLSFIILPVRTTRQILDSQEECQSEISENRGISRNLAFAGGAKLIRRCVIYPKHTKNKPTAFTAYSFQRKLILLSGREGSEGLGI
jgi:hypothetical protein